jgi:hypothetical protein
MFAIPVRQDDGRYEWREVTSDNPEAGYEYLTARAQSLYATIERGRTMLRTLPTDTRTRRSIDRSLRNAMEELEDLLESVVVPS